MKKVILEFEVLDKGELITRLDEISLRFSASYWMHERVYAPKNFQEGAGLPRLVMRTEMKSVDKPAQYKLVFKRHIEDSGVDIVEETAVRDYTETERIILQLGFKLYKETARQRQMLSMGKDTVLYLDKREHEAVYAARVESELYENDSVEALRLDLIKTLNLFGLVKIKERK